MTSSNCFFQSRNRGKWLRLLSWRFILASKLLLMPGNPANYAQNKKKTRPCKNTYNPAHTILPFKCRCVETPFLVFLSYQIRATCRCTWPSDEMSMCRSSDFEFFTFAFALTSNSHTPFCPSHCQLSETSNDSCFSFDTYKHIQTGSRSHTTLQTSKRRKCH